jgi:hypothetical protein
MDSRKWRLEPVSEIDEPGWLALGITRVLPVIRSVANRSMLQKPSGPNCNSGKCYPNAIVEIEDPLHSDYLLAMQEALKKQEPHVKDETQSNEIKAEPPLSPTQQQNQSKYE